MGFKNYLADQQDWIHIAIFFLVLFCVCTWRMAMNLNDPRCETELEALTQWSCVEAAHKPNAGCMCACPCPGDKEMP